MNAIENRRLRDIFLMLKSDLADSDIPSRSTLRRRIEDMFEEHLKDLEREIKVRITLLALISYLLKISCLELCWKDFVYYRYVD